MATPLSVLASAVVIAGLVAGPAMAADPVAIVEDASPTVRGVSAMDYLTAGTVVHLAAGATLTVGYLRSCVDEVITGGTVTIGSQQSVVADGKVARRKVECDGGRMKLSPQQAAQGGVFALRGKPPADALPQPDVVLFGTKPLLRLESAGSVRIVRLDQSADAVAITVEPGNLSYDFANHDAAFVPGGLYRATGPAGQVVFQIDPQARATDVPVIGRLLHL